MCSDAAKVRFGVREVSGRLDASGSRLFAINGRDLPIRGAGWAPDLFRRWDPTAVRDKLKYVLDLGLNAVRLEGHIEADEFFELTDEPRRADSPRLGVL